MKYNKLNKYNIDTLKLLYNLVNKSGVSPNKEDIANNLELLRNLLKKDITFEQAEIWTEKII